MASVIQRELDSNWRTEVFRRDKRACQMPWCPRRADDAHHIKSKAAHPDSRHDVNNGIALCRECHTKAHLGLISVEELQKAVSK